MDLIREAGGSERRHKDNSQRGEDAALLALKMEVGATSRGKQAACRGWEGKGYPLSLSEEPAIHFEFLTSRTTREHGCVA